MINKYLESIKNDNTRNSVISLVKELENYMSMKDKTIEEMDELDLDLFIKRTMNGKSSTSISAFISRIKGLFFAIGKGDLVKDLNLMSVREIINIKRNTYFTPSEIHDIIEKLINYQDKALVLLVYMGLYDNDFDTIRNIQIKDIKDGYLKIGEKQIKLNYYCNDILTKASKEIYMEKYVFQENRASSTYELNINSPYLIRSKNRKGGDLKLSSPTLKKRFEVFAKYLGIDNLSPITIKNSRVIYDIIRKEYDENFGLEINQLELKNILKDNNIKGTIEQLNMDKKRLRMKIIDEIISGKTVFID